MADQTPGSSRQKVIIIAFIIILLIVAWQVMGLFSGGGTIKPTTVKTTTVASKTTNIPSGPAASAPLASSQSTMTPQEVPLIARDTQLIKVEQETQDKYINQLNELQMLKLQKEIAETNQAIANATLAKVTAEKHISDLLTKSSAPSLPTSRYASQLAPSPQPIPPPPVAVGPSSYVVLSVSQQLGQWHAVLGYQGTLYNVMVGDVLPPDGSVVSEISRRGVTLKKDGQKIKVSLVAAV